MEILYKTNQVLPRVGEVDIFSGFKESLSIEKYKKFEKRKDVKILLELKNKYDMITNKHCELRKLEKSKEKLKSKKGPVYNLRNRKNLFDLSIKEVKQLEDIFEMYFKYENDLNMNLISYLPNLNKIEISFSKLILNFPKNMVTGNFFRSLCYLDLSFNNLTNSIFEYVKEITSIKYLNLAGNTINADLPDITNLINIEELNLSYNQISSHFLNLNDNKNQLIEVLEKIQQENLSAFYPSSEFVENHLSTTTEANKISHSTSETEFNVNTLKTFVSSRSGYEELNKILKTNVQEFFHTLSNLKNLNKLDISHNKIHFFDLDPIRLHKENGFNKLKNLNISYNLIFEEISILLVVNIPKLESIDISHNPIVENKRAYDNIEYEIFKNKNILLINDKSKENENTFFKNKIDRCKIDLEKEKFCYKIKHFDILDACKFSENVKKNVEKKSKYFSKIQKEIEDYGDFINSNKDEKIIDEVYESRELLRKDSGLFITKAHEIVDVHKKKINKNKHENNSDRCESYNQFLHLANICFGNQKHYKKTIPINKAYQRLKYVLNKTIIYKDKENANYMKPTISNLHHHLDNE